MSVRLTPPNALSLDVKTNVFRNLKHYSSSHSEVEFRVKTNLSTQNAVFYMSGVSMPLFRHSSEIHLQFLPLEKSATCRMVISVS